MSLLNDLPSEVRIASKLSSMFSDINIFFVDY